MPEQENASGVFRDDTGNASSMRVMSFMSLFAAFGTAAVLLVKNPTDATTGLYLFSGFMIGAFVPKAIQKFAEQKITKP